MVTELKITKGTLAQLFAFACVAAYEWGGLLERLLWPHHRRAELVTDILLVVAMLAVCVRQLLILRRLGKQLTETLAQMRVRR